MVLALIDEGHQKWPTALPAAGSSTNGKSSSVKASLKWSGVLSDAVAQAMENLRPLTHVWVLELRETDLCRALRITMRRKVVRIAVLFLDFGVRWSQLRGLRCC
jgi:hypothetical protein